LEPGKKNCERKASPGDCAAGQDREEIADLGDDLLELADILDSPGRAIRYALKHLVDEGCSERPPKVYYIKGHSRAAAIAINEAMEIVG
jgi:hypothetical protein